MKFKANSDLNIRKNEQRYLSRKSLKSFKKLAHKESRSNAKVEIKLAIAA
jgi:hypothetical protein